MCPSTRRSTRMSTPAPGICTGMLVDRHLGGRHRAWAVVAAFGDNLVRRRTRSRNRWRFPTRGWPCCATSADCLTYNAYSDDPGRRDRAAGRTLPDAAARRRSAGLRRRRSGVRGDRRGAAARHRPRARDAAGADAAGGTGLHPARRAVDAPRARHLRQRARQRGARPRARGAHGERGRRLHGQRARAARAPDRRRRAVPAIPRRRRPRGRGRHRPPAEGALSRIRRGPRRRPFADPPPARAGGRGEAAPGPLCPGHRITR